MTDILVPSVRRVAAPTARRARSVVHNLLERLAVGRIDLIDSDGSACRFGSTASNAGSNAASNAASADAPRAAMHVHDNALYARVLRNGDVGLGEAYVANEWSSPDLVALLVVLMRNRGELERAVYGTWWGTLAQRLLHGVRRNSRTGSRRNIEAHYDLGNDFYRLWLDPSMNYSSGWFDGDAARTLEASQLAKTSRALDEARVGEGTRLLEIGCGWGALAAQAARRGATVDGVTLSHEQLAWGHQRLREADLHERATLALRDYRDLGATSGFVPYDAVVSIEMFEAVGRSYWAGWFQTLARCLARDGRACVQTITIRDDLFERYARSTDFIQQYIFPGGLLPSPSAFRAEVAKAGLVVERELCFGADYARTLAAWRQRFHAELPAVRALGYSERFVRLWDFYLAYCEAAFTTGNTDVCQFTLRHA